MNFKKWVKSIQTAGYNGARTVHITFLLCSDGIPKVVSITEPSCPLMKDGTIARLEDLTRNSEYPGKDSNYEVD